MRIKSPFPAGFKNIVLTGKGKTTTKHNNELFDKVPFEDPHNQGVTAGYVEVFRGTAAAPAPELDLGGVYQEASPSVAETTVGGNTLVHAKKVEWARNRYT